MAEVELMNLSKYAKIFPKEAVESPTGSRDGEGVTRQAILNRINRGKELPYVTKIELIGRQYILHVKKP